MTSKTYEVVTYSYKDGTEDPETYTVMIDGKDTFMVDENRELLEQWAKEQISQ